VRSPVRVYGDEANDPSVLLQGTWSSFAPSQSDFTFDPISTFGCPRSKLRDQSTQLIARAHIAGLAGFSLSKESMLKSQDMSKAPSPPDKQPRGCSYAYTAQLKDRVGKSFHCHFWSKALPLRHDLFHQKRLPCITHPSTTSIRARSTRTAA